jgi:hypothetical protein
LIRSLGIDRHGQFVETRPSAKSPASGVTTSRAPANAPARAPQVGHSGGQRTNRSPACGNLRWDSMKMAEHYTRAADQRRMAEKGMHLLTRGASETAER